MTNLHFEEVKLGCACVHHCVEVFVACEFGFDQTADMSLQQKQNVGLMFTAREKHHCVVYIAGFILLTSSDAPTILESMNFRMTVETTHARHCMSYSNNNKMRRYWIRSML